MLILTVIQGPDKGRRFELPDDEPQLIGRSSEALPLMDQTISRRHAELIPDDGKWYINDIQSANGSFVNGHRVTRPRLLQQGDQIRTGLTLFVYGREDKAKLFDRNFRVTQQGEMDINVEATAASNDDSMILAVTDPAEGAVLQLRVVYEMTQLIGSVVEQDQLLNSVMDLIFDYFEADRGFILFIEKPKDTPTPIVVRHREPPQEDNKQIAISHTIVHHVVKKGESVLSSNAMTDTRFSGGDSVQDYAIRSAMCVPIKYKDRIFGVIQIDSQIANYTFTDDQLRLLTAIGVHTGLALANAELYSDRLQQERLAAIGQTVASLSHSIKNILQGMRGGADVVELGFKKKNMKVIHGGWQIVSRNLERIYELTLNMLAFSKQRKPELEMSSITMLLDEIFEMMQAQFDNKKVALISDFSSDLPPIPIDASGIHQALLNLISNALDATKSETGAVTLSCQYDEHQQQVKIHVADNGDGMDQDQIKRLFMPFNSSKGLKGTGLGLVVTKKIISEHGGHIQVESELGQGTTFTVSLPCTIKAPSLADTQGPATILHDEQVNLPDSLSNEL